MHRRESGAYGRGTGNFKSVAVGLGKICSRADFIFIGTWRREAESDGDGRCARLLIYKRVW